MIRSLDPDALLESVASVAARLLGVEDVQLWLHDDSAEVLRLGARIPAGDRDGDLTLPTGDSLIGSVLRSGQPFTTTRVADHPLWRAEIPHVDGPLGGLFVPLTVDERPRGVLVGLSTRAPTFRDDDVRVLRTLATQAVVAVRDARTHQETSHQARQLTAILDVNKQLALGPELDEILSRIAEGAARLLDAEGATLRLLEGDALKVVATYGPAEPVAADQPVPIAASLSGRVATENRPIIFTDLAGDPRADPARWRAARVSGLHSWLGVPLRGRERVLGTLAVLSRGERRFTKGDLGLIEAFADQAAVAIENARLFKQAATAEALRELARLKTEFMRTASHELRMPVTLIYSYSELLMVRAAELSPDEVTQMAGEIHGGAGTMARLVDDLLDFSRLEEEGLKLQRRRVVISEVLGWLVETFRKQPGGERITTEIGDGIEAFVDPERLGQVVGNLLANALRYAPEGPILLRVGRQDGWLNVEVTDRGPGIPPDEQPRLWEKFYRGSAGRGSTHRGSGLGLSVVKHLVELHGGRVDVRSAPDRGTTFRLTIPADEPGGDGSGGGRGAEAGA